jgi:hypothetical protein
MGDAKDVECSVQGMLMTLFVLADPVLQRLFSEKEMNVFPVRYHLRTSVRANSTQHIGKESSRTISRLLGSITRISRSALVF